MAGFNTAITGLKAATTDLDVTGNNIANSSTIGFKSSRTEFGDIYATAVVGAGSSNVAGSGVIVTDIAQDFQAGTIEFTNNNLDLAINGSGFFQLDDGQGGVTYTRAGAFELDKEGFIVSKSGKNLQGYGLDASGNRLPIGDLAVTEKESRPKATADIDLAFNIDSRGDATKLLEDYDKDNAGSFTYSTTLRTFDSLGNEHTIKFNMAEARPFQARQDIEITDTASTDLIGISEAVGVQIDDFFAGGAVTTNAINAVLAGDSRLENVEVVTDTSVVPTKNYIRLIFKAQYPEPELATVDGAGIASGDALAPVEIADQAANEVHVFDFGDAAFGGAAPANDALTADSSITIGGVTIQLKAGVTRDQVGDELQKLETQIKNSNPNVESILFDSEADELTVTYKADVGDVSAAADVVSISSTGAAGLMASPAGEIHQGDNSYLGVYRMYAYLNGAELLDIGKKVDPGENGFTNTTSPVPTEKGPILLKFEPSSGLLTSVNGDNFSPGSVIPDITISGADPANEATKISLDLTNTTQFASASIVKAATQDGYTKGDLIGVTFAETGEMVASFSNGQTQNLGVVAFATFENQSGLQPSGNTEWTATLASGGAILNPPGTGLNGSLRSAALEQSNVDLSSELVRLIEAQRNFQANSKTLETLNTVTQAILQI